MHEKNRLDQVEHIREVDSAGMFSYLAAFDRQIEQALTVAQQLESIAWLGAFKPRQIVYAGMGGSAIAGDLVSDLVGPQLQVPFLVNRDYRLPFADSESLVVLSSYSGNTAETLSCYAQARKKGARLVAMTSGGQLLEESRRHGTPAVLIPGGYPPRCALGFFSVLLLSLLERWQLAPSFNVAGWNAWLGPRLEGLSPETPSSDNQAKQLAGSLHGRIVIVYGSQGHLTATARRWAGQFAENGKQLAYFSPIPEMNHNEVVGWRHPAEELGGLAAVFLRDREEDPEVAKRCELTTDLVRERSGHCENVWSTGSSWPERLWSLVLLGDYVSVYSAILNGENPTPVRVIEELKRRLKEEGDEG